MTRIHHLILLILYEKDMGNGGFQGKRLKRCSRAIIKS